MPRSVVTIQLLATIMSLVTGLPVSAQTPPEASPVYPRVNLAPHYELVKGWP